MNIIRAQKKHIVQASQILFEAYYDSQKSAANYLRQKIQSKEVLVMLHENIVVGVLIYTRNFSHYSNYVEDIVVAKKYRRKGIAKKLLSYYVHISRQEQPNKQSYALSSTNVENKISIKMHKKFGFKVLGKVKKLHYGKDEIIFGYSLK